MEDEKVERGEIAAEEGRGERGGKGKIKKIEEQVVGKGR